MPSPVLLVTITNVKLPVNADVLFAIFNKYGEVLRVVLFDKQQGEQALVEMSTLEQAVKAKQETNSQYIYSSTNLMQTQFSQRTKLSVKNQTSRARDYTLLLNDFYKHSADKKLDELPQKKKLGADDGPPAEQRDGNIEDHKSEDEDDPQGILKREEFCKLFS